MQTALDVQGVRVKSDQTNNISHPTPEASHVTQEEQIQRRNLLVMNSQSET